MIDQASVDRAAALLLDVAEGTVEPDHARVEAAQTVLYTASQMPTEDELAGYSAVDPGYDIDRAVETAFREGAKWGRSHARGGFPGRERVIELVTEKLGASA